MKTVLIVKKQVECDDCGFVNEQPKAYPLKLSSCKTCGSTKIRLYKPMPDAKKERSDG